MNRASVVVQAGHDDGDYWPHHIETKPSQKFSARSYILCQFVKLTTVAETESYDADRQLSCSYRDGECRLLERRRRCGEVDRDLDRRRAISSFIFFAFCLALKNSNNPSFSQPSLHNIRHTNCISSQDKEAKMFGKMSIAMDKWTNEYADAYLYKYLT